MYGEFPTHRSVWPSHVRACGRARLTGESQENKKNQGLQAKRCTHELDTSKQWCPVRVQEAKGAHEKQSLRDPHPAWPPGAVAARSTVAICMRSGIFFARQGVVLGKVSREKNCAQTTSLVYVHPTV